MKCEEVQRYLSPYLDSELDPKTSFEMERHLEQCLNCRERLESEGQLERAVVEELRRPEAGDEELWRKAMSRARRPSKRRWVWTAAGLVLAALGALAGLWAMRGTSDSLSHDLREDYLKYQAGRSPLDVSSPDAQPVKQFFQDKMGLAVPVLSRVGEMQLEGGRKCSLRGAPTAFLVYRCKGGTISLSIFNADQLDRFPGVGSLEQSSIDESRGIRVLALRSGWKVICATGNVSSKELVELCNAYRNAPEQPR